MLDSWVWLDAASLSAYCLKPIGSEDRWPSPKHRPQEAGFSCLYAEVRLLCLNELSRAWNTYGLPRRKTAIGEV